MIMAARAIKAQLLKISKVMAVVLNPAMEVTQVDLEMNTVVEAMAAPVPEETTTAAQEAAPMVALAVVIEYKWTPALIRSLMRAADLDLEDGMMLKMPRERNS